MASIAIEYHSVVLGMERKVNVIYPDQSEIPKKDQGDKDIPVLYLLHGMGGNENSCKNEQLLNACCGIPI